jgi:DNA-binding MurR/RpiR family transcriptional regulator
MTGSTGKTVAERLRGGFQELTRAERQLANALLDNYPILGLGSITAVAESASDGPQVDTG